MASRRPPSTTGQERTISEISASIRNIEVFANSLWQPQETVALVDAGPVAPPVLASFAVTAGASTPHTVTAFRRTRCTFV